MMAYDEEESSSAALRQPIAQEGKKTGTSAVGAASHFSVHHQNQQVGPGMHKS